MEHGLQKAPYPLEVETAPELDEADKIEAAAFDKRAKKK